MSTNAVRAEATASTRATVYQLCLAVEQCYKLQPGQKLLIEELGDITQEDKQQIEVKAYSDTLTDGHPNFWNTITNWMDPQFIHSAYEALILLTTQAFSSTATLASWNESDSRERLAILSKINAGFEQSAANSLAKDPQHAPSKTLKQQRKILDQANRSRLLSIIDKVFIEASSPTMPALYDRIRNERSFGVLKKNKDVFINSLMGFICKLGKSKDTRWEILQEDFDKECQHLMNIFGSESRDFPTTHFENFDKDTIDSNREDLFIKKIREIDHLKFISYAIREYESTVDTIAFDFREYSIAAKNLHTFREAVDLNFQLNYDTASKSPPLDIISAQKFYNATLTSPPPSFKGYNDSQLWFRNGIIHMAMNDHSKEYQWKLNRP